MIHVLQFLWMRYFIYLSEVTSHLLTTSFWAQKEYMLSTDFDFLEDMRHRFVLALEVPGFFQGMLPPWSQSLFWN